MVALRASDYMNKLVEYVEKNLQKGRNSDQIKLLLLNQGYSRAAVDRAIRLAEQKKPAPLPPIEFKEEPKIEPIMEPEHKGFFSKLFGIFKTKKQEELPSTSA